MALGAGSVTMLEMASGYSVFANGGYRVAPYFISTRGGGEREGAGQGRARFAQARARNA